MGGYHSPLLPPRPSPLLRSFVSIPFFFPPLSSLYPLRVYTFHGVACTNSLSLCPPDEEEIRSRRGRLLFRGWNDDLGLGFTAAIGAERYPLRLYDCIYASIASQTSPLKTYYHSRVESED